MVSNLCASSDDAAESVSVLLSGRQKIQRGNYSVTKCRSSFVLILCTLSDNTLYLYEVSLKYLLWS